MLILINYLEIKLKKYIKPIKNIYASFSFYKFTFSIPELYKKYYAQDKIEEKMKASFKEKIKKKNNPQIEMAICGVASETSA